ncbi:glycosyltransferase family 4 protein [Desertivirga xinjiangensis]|uniref:glycosyltransferase family 4 protein n=1 Tax=Desertivirga xinjiangensis TaxID=539206 RepID=UPI00210D4ACA
MKILIVTQYFWPENFRINDLALALTERGHEIVVLTGQPNYPQGKFYPGYSFFSRRIEFLEKIKIYRSPMIPRGRSGSTRLFLNYLSFAFFNSLRGFLVKETFDRILVYEPSPITVGIPAIFMKWLKKAPIFFWVQDLWPQSVIAAGGVTNKWIVDVLDGVTRWIYKKSDKILVQSEAFREVIEKQGVSSNKIVFYPNSVESLFNVLPPKIDTLNKLPAGFKILFAGNIGESQDFETIIEAARLVSLKTNVVQWVILGDGRKFSYVQQRIKELGLQDQFHLLGAFSLEMMPDFYACADCLLVSLKREPIFSLTIPSKIQSYLASGKPILASLDGEGARVVQEAKAGLTVEAENPIGLAAKVLEFYELSEFERVQMGANARNYFEKNFEREFLVTQLEKIFRGEFTD